MQRAIMVSIISTKCFECYRAMTAGFWLFLSNVLYASGGDTSMVMFYDPRKLLDAVGKNGKYLLKLILRLRSKIMQLHGTTFLPSDLRHPVLQARKKRVTLKLIARLNARRLPWARPR